MSAAPLYMERTVIDQSPFHLIGNIYDTILAPDLWPDVLGQLSAHIGGCGASIYGKNSVEQTADIAYDNGVDPGFKQSYLDTYVRMDPTTVGFFFFDIGDAVTIADIQPYSEFLKSRFHNDWVKPQGWCDMATVVLEKSSASYGVFTVFRHERLGQSDDRMRHRLEQLTPHIRRANHIGRTLLHHKTQAATLSDALDNLSTCLFLVDAGGHLVQANLSGQRMLSDGSVLRSFGGRLRALDPVADDAIQTALGSNPSHLRGGARSTIPLSSASNRHHVMHVLPLQSGTRQQAEFGAMARNAIFVSKAEMQMPTTPDIIARVYGLTPGELRVLLALFDTSGVPEIAAALAISEATTKTHLNRLFGKTGTKRQADLVKLVAGFVGPIRSSLDQQTKTDLNH